MHQSCLLLLGIIAIVAAQNTCSSNTDCIPIYEFCPQDCIDASCICEHKGLLPFTFVEIMGILLTAILITLANAGGIGGGSLILPVVSLLFHFHQNQAGSISTFLVLVAAVTRFITNFNQMHPRRDRVLINYDIVAVVMPMALLGTVLGVNLNLTLPEGVQVIILAIVLLYVGYSTLKKGRALYKSENSKKIGASTSFSYANSSLNTPLIAGRPDPRLEAIQARERTHCPFSRLLYVWAIFAMLLVTAIIPGPKENPIVPIEKCGVIDWGLKGLLALVCVVVIICVGRSLLAEEKLKYMIGYNFDEEDVRWNVKGIVTLSVFSLLCGALASTVGIGGGVLYNPLLLLVGVNPQVAAASGMYITLYNTLSTVAQFLILGRLPIVWSLFLGVFVVGCSVIGIMVINSWVKRSGRQSLIVFILGGLVLMSAVVTPVFSFLNMQGKAFSIWSFGSIC